MTALAVHAPPVCPLCHGAAWIADPFGCEAPVPCSCTAPTPADDSHLGSVLALAAGGNLAANLLGDIKRMLNNPKSLTPGEVEAMVEILSRAREALTEPMHAYYESRATQREISTAVRKAE